MVEKIKTEPTPGLTLYPAGKSHDTGNYFCNREPFSSPLTGNRVSIGSDGQSVLRRIHQAMLRAKSFIWIADWQMAHDIELSGRDDPTRPGRLHNVIRHLISSRPVHIRILLYGSILDSKPGTYDRLVSLRINELNRKHYPGTVRAMCHLSTSAQVDDHDYSHHQKFLVVDGELAFIGGIDLSYGRWDDGNFDVVIDPERYVINEMYNPCQVKRRGLSSSEKHKIADFGFELPYGGAVLEEGCQPRMPWQDVHIEIDGPAVVDIHRNFVRRWNACTNQQRSYGAPSSMLPRIDRKWLEQIGGYALLTAAQIPRPGGAQVQIVRSVSSKLLKQEGTRPDDLQLVNVPAYYLSRYRQLMAWQSNHQSNIYTAMVNCIRSADNYIYIETQFFISDFGRRGIWDSSKLGNENNGIQNTIVEEIANRIDRHIVARGNLPFHVYLVIPSFPEGPIADEPVWKQHWLALTSIKHGTHSLIGRIKSSLSKVSRRQEEWPQYLTVLNMRNYGATVMYARDPVTFDEDRGCEIGRYVITEQIYIHSKLMIVDDAVAIIGSANTNDRSLTGNGDTEIAAVVVDTEGVELRDLGSPTLQVQTRGFARELRIRLWEKHFGFAVEPDGKGYFDATRRAKRSNKAVPVKLPHPPREEMTEERFEKITGFDWSEIKNRPCSPSTVQAIQTIVSQNAKIYDQVFWHIPRNGVTTFNQTADAGLRTLPYAASHHSPGDLFGAYINPYDVPEKYRGVVPPELETEFMTTDMHPHQQQSLRERNYARRQQSYPGGRIHDVKKAISVLSKNIVGFFVLAPLDWGLHHPVIDDPTKVTAIDVDISSRDDSATIGRSV